MNQATFDALNEQQVVDEMQDRLEAAIGFADKVGVRVCSLVSQIPSAADADVEVTAMRGSLLIAKAHGIAAANIFAGVAPTFGGK